MTAVNCRFGDYDVEDTCNVEFDVDGKPGTAFISCVYPEKREEFVVFGSRGSAILTPGYIERRNRNQEVLDRLDSPRNWRTSMLNQLVYFVDGIERVIDARYSTPQFQIDNHVPTLEACYLSWETHARVNVRDVMDRRY